VKEELVYLGVDIAKAYLDANPVAATNEPSSRRLLVRGCKSAWCKQIG